MGSIDADAHVIENPLTFEYIDAADQKLRPMVVQQVSGSTVASNEGGVQKRFWVIDGRVQPMEGNIGSNTSEESREMRDVSSRLKHMDELEIDVQVLFPTVFLRAWTQNERIEYALCRSYNRWLADIWKKAGDRLRWAVMPPLLSSWDKVRAELEFAKAHGACSIFIRGLEIERSYRTSISIRCGRWRRTSISPSLFTRGTTASPCAIFTRTRPVSRAPSCRSSALSIRC